MTKKALYLAGGGARGAYQAGVLKGINIILNVNTIPFDMISGVSVGSINAAILAENALSFSAGTEKLETLWSNIHCQDIFDATNYALSKSLLRSFIKQNKTGHLLNTSPLSHFITKMINFDTVETNIKNHHLKTMEVISHCYETHQTISFYQHDTENFVDWKYPRHSSQPVTLQMEHILASSSLPLFFPPTNINGFHYGDGSIGLAAPLRGAIRSQVDKILILGTRQSPTFAFPKQTDSSDIGLAQILGSILNGVFLDNLDRDVEMVNRMNDITNLLSIWKKHRSSWRPIETLHLQPSRNIATIAQSHYNNMPKLLRLLLNFLGAKSHSGDLLSFLLFEKEFTKELIQLGVEDTLAEQESVLKFFEV